MLAMFPGQGSQYVGMGKEACEQFPYTKVIFEESSDAIGIDIYKLCVSGPLESLILTHNTQPAILTTSYAYWKVLKEEKGLEPLAFAGHSLGEYTALVASERLAFQDAVKLVRKRGEAMQNAVPAGLGAMAAVLKCPREELEEACAGISSPKALVEIANDNSPGQLVVAGHLEAVEQLIQLLSERKVRAVKLPVSAPFHSQLMGPAKDVMRPLIEAAEISREGAPILPNLSGQWQDHYDKEDLIDQMDHPVLWTQTLEAAAKRGLEQFIEIGPGKVLSGLVKRTVKDGLIITTDQLKSSLTQW